MVTVIVPFKNAAPWIKRCADSLMAQDGELEVIWVNDGSEDGSDDIVAEYAGDKFLLVDNEDMRGVSGARNTGLKYAHGDWITFLDADDEYAPFAMNALNASIRMYPDAELIQLNHVRVTSQGVHMPRMFNPRGKYTLDHLPKLWMSTCNKLFKRDLIRGLEFITGLNHGEDELFVLNCLERARAVYCSEHIALHYHKDNPRSLSTVTSFDDLVDEQGALLEFIELHRNDIELCGAVRIRQTELWNNAVYKRTFGG